MKRRSIFHFLHSKSRLSVVAAVLICVSLAVSACNPVAATQYPAPGSPPAGNQYPAPAIPGTQPGKLPVAGETPVQPLPSTETPQAIESPAAGGGNAGLPNPASVYCEENGGKLEIRSDASGGQYGVCVFANGSECEEWSYFRKECKPWQLEPTPDINLVQDYQNSSFDFSLAYPEGWSLEETADSLRLQRGEYTLFIGFWRSDAETPLFRTGMPEGEFVESGSFTLLGQTLPRRTLVAEGKVKLVDYGFGLTFEDLRLAIWLDARDQPPATYRDRNLPAYIIQEAEAILNSLSRKTTP